MSKEVITKETTTETGAGGTEVTVKPGTPAETSTVTETTTESPGVKKETSVETK